MKGAQLYPRVRNPMERQELRLNGQSFGKGVQAVFGMASMSQEKARERPVRILEPVPMHVRMIAHCSQLE
jgi:hypothetical protein